MRAKTLISMAVAMLATSLAPAQSKTLTIGDPAPNLAVSGWAKGSPVPAFEKGKVYVVEFWATWCGPCIAAMPHLSEVSDKFQGKATIISVNTWDYAKTAEGKEDETTHRQRVSKFVAENDAKMRYNIAFDDASDTVATTWMTAAGRNGIPCAFIVDQDSRIAWIGHPMAKMEDVIEQVHNKTWNLAEYKAKFEEQAKKEREQAKLRQDVTAAAKAGDMAQWEAAVGRLSGDKDQNLMMGIQLATTANADFSWTLVEKHAGKVKGIDPYVWCSTAATVAERSKNAAIKAKAVKLSEECAKMTTEGLAALTYIYHARVEFAAGNKDKALDWAKRATAAVDKYEPATGRESVRKYIDTQVKRFNGESK